jgi:hypothetical protein
MTLLERGTAWLSVAAEGSAPRAIQWFKNGRAIADATQSSMVISNLTGIDGADYHAVVTNALSKVESLKARVRVRSRPSGAVVSWEPGGALSPVGMQDIAAMEPVDGISIGKGVAFLKSSGQIVLEDLSSRRPPRYIPKDGVLNIVRISYGLLILEQSGRVSELNLLGAGRYEAGEPQQLSYPELTQILSISAYRGIRVALRADGWFFAWDSQGMILRAHDPDLIECGPALIGQRRDGTLVPLIPESLYPETSFRLPVPPIELGPVAEFSLQVALLPDGTIRSWESGRFVPGFRSPTNLTSVFGQDPMFYGLDALGVPISLRSDTENPIDARGIVALRLLDWLT